MKQSGGRDPYSLAGWVVLLDREADRRHEARMLPSERQRLRPGVRWIWPNDEAVTSGWYTLIDGVDFVSPDAGAALDHESGLLGVRHADTE